MVSIAESGLHAGLKKQLSFQMGFLGQAVAPQGDPGWLRLLVWASGMPTNYGLNHPSSRCRITPLRVPSKGNITYFMVHLSVTVGYAERTSADWVITTAITFSDDLFRLANMPGATAQHNILIRITILKYDQSFPMMVLVGGPWIAGDSHLLAMSMTIC